MAIITPIDMGTVQAIGEGTVEVGHALHLEKGEGRLAMSPHNLLRSQQPCNPLAVDDVQPIQGDPVQLVLCFMPGIHWVFCRVLNRGSHRACQGLFLLVQVQPL